ncbi:hypothetical protein WA026_010096 [Henosepilachna vigintioctopunctata]|uniref:Uncharacterized protein n=1 Tax=Henosepilachna vigintioctopunctata TaxID=420089 RepID=A0AAW1UI81_9CUCU
MEVVRIEDQPVQVQKVTVKHAQRCQKFISNSENRQQKGDPRYLFEKHLRDNQLSTVLRSLLMMEAKLKREQKRITQQLYQKDFIIQKQKEDIQKILYSQYCKKCSRLYNPGFHLESSEYSPTSHDGNLSSFVIDNGRIAPLLDKNLNSNISSPSDSSCDELLHHGSDGECADIKLESTNIQDGNLSTFVGDDRTAFLPDKEISSIKKFPSYSSCEDSEFHAPIPEYPYRSNEKMRPLRSNLSLENSNSSCGSFQPRSNSDSSFSDEENTSDDYDNLESLPTEILGDELSVKSLDSEKVCSEESFDKSSNHYNVDSTSLSFSESNITVIRNIPLSGERAEVVENQYKSDVEESCPESKLPQSSLQFDLEVDSNEKWYVSASDHEDEQEKNIYKNNPVLECVNQILLQNIDTEYDSLNFSNKSTYVYNELDSNDKNKVHSEQLNLKHNGSEKKLKEFHNNYYETPIQEPPNFYETPVSVYSNDYEQIRSKCSDTQSTDSLQFTKKEGNAQKKYDFERKYKILRTPPSLPPKPVNLVSKYRIQYNQLKFNNEKLSDRISLDSEPDYCSISELNLPTNRSMIPDKTKVIAEIHATNEDHDDFLSKTNHYDFVEPQTSDRLTEQTNEMEKQNYKSIKISYDSPKSSLSNNIPKLPSVSEIIIPEEADKKVNTQYNHTKNSPQVHKTKINSSSRKPIKIGSSVSALIMNFNNKELLYEINKKALTSTRQNELLAAPSNSCIESEANNEDCFIQNFEEFKLDDCELQEFTDRTDELGGGISESEIETTRLNIDNKLNTFKNTTELRTLAEEVADIDLTSLNLNDFIGKLERCNNRSKPLIKDVPSYNWKDESTYEDFLECTGLSSKSILSSSQVTNTNHKNIDIN